MDTFEADLQSVGNTINNIYSGWQTQETMANTRSSVEEMQNRVAYVKAAEMILFLNNAIIEKLHMIFDYLCEIDVEWFDYESE